MRGTQKGQNRPLLLFLPIPSLSTTSSAHVMPLLSLSPSCSRSSSLVAPLKCSTACLGACAVMAGLALPPLCAGFCICVCPDPPPPEARAAAVIPPALQLSSCPLFPDSLLAKFLRIEESATARPKKQQKKDSSPWGMIAAKFLSCESRIRWARCSSVRYLHPCERYRRLRRGLRFRGSGEERVCLV